MSTTISEKIEMIRVREGLTQPDFADAVGVSINTYKGILKRGSSPRFDVIQKIASKWPKYSLWLLTGAVEPENKQVAPTDESVSAASALFRVVDRVDARFMGSCIIKADSLTKLLFVQSAHDKDDLAAIFKVDNEIMYKISNREDDVGAVWVAAGNINFNSDGSGRNALKAFRVWLLEQNPDLIRNAEYWQLEHAAFENVFKELCIPANALQKVSDQVLYEKFRSWVSGGGGGYA